MTATQRANNAHSARIVPTLPLDRRVARLATATVVVGGYMAAGAAFGLGADAYLLLGIPITVAFQLLVARRPLRALWLRDARPIAVTARSALAVAALSIAPIALALRGAGAGDPILVGYGLVSIAGAVGAVHAMRAMDRDAIRATVRASAVNGAILVGVMVAYRLVSGGFTGNVGGSVVALVTSVATYLPAVFVLEEVFFRGALDPYLRDSALGAGRGSSAYGSALWGAWHLPVAFVSFGGFTLPYLVAIHVVLGHALVASWRRTGNLAAPGIAHAVSDGLRNAVAAL